MPVSPFNADFL